MSLEAPAVLGDVVIAITDSGSRLVHGVQENDVSEPIPGRLPEINSSAWILELPYPS